MARMGLSGIRYIYAARLGARAVLVQEGFAIVGIAVGVALLFASQISSTSLTRSATQLNTQLVGSAQVQLDARGPEGFGEGLLAQVRRVPGVRVALPIVERQVNLTGPGGERSADLIGVDLRLVHVGGRLPRRFAAEQLATLPVIALPEPLAGEIGAVGSLARVELQIGARVQRTLVAATLREGDIGGLVHDPIAIAPIGYAQRVARAPAQLSRIFVRYDPARSGAVRPALARLAANWNVNLVAADFDSRLFALAVAPESKSEALFSGISALVGFMFALNAMLVTVPSRRRLIEDVRPHGATRWMTIQILLFDAAVLGVLGCILGLVLGDILSIAVYNSTPGYLAFAFPVGSQRIVTWHSVALAVAAGFAAAIIGVLWPLRQNPCPPVATTIGLGEPSPGLDRGADHRRRILSSNYDVHPVCGYTGGGGWEYRARRRARLPAAVSLRWPRERLRVCVKALGRCGLRARGHRASDAADSSALAGDRRDRGGGGFRRGRVSGRGDEPQERSRRLDPRDGLERRSLGDTER